MTTNYPDWAAGDQVSAQALNDTEGYYIYKASTTGPRTGTTPLADPDLTFEMDANAVYLVKTSLRYTCLNADDFRTDWTTPSGAAGLRSCLGQAARVATDASGDTAEADIVHIGVHGFGTDVDYGNSRNSGTNQVSAWEEAIVTTTSSGTFAQNWSSANGGSGANLSSGSYLWYKRIA